MPAKKHEQPKAPASRQLSALDLRAAGFEYEAIADQRGLASAEEAVQAVLAEANARLAISEDPEVRRVVLDAGLAQRERVWRNHLVGSDPKTPAGREMRALAERALAKIHAQKVQLHADGPGDFPPGARPAYPRGGIL